MPNIENNVFQRNRRRIFMAVSVALLCVCMADLSFTQNINTEENFPDPYFREAAENYMGVRRGGAFTAAEAAANYWPFSCYNPNIKNATGIEFFTGTLTLYFNYTQIEHLDLSHNTKLNRIKCENNQLKSLTIPNANHLRSLDCSLNQLKSLTIPDATYLSFFNCSYNQLTDLNFTDNYPVLDKLHCSFNQLKNLDLSNMPALRFLYCDNNQLTNLNLSNVPALITLECFNNQLTSLDVSHNKVIRTLLCSDNLLTNISSLIACTRIGRADVRNNNLSCDDWATIQVLQNRIGSRFYYSPQNNLDPFECGSIDMSYLVNGDGLGGRYWPSINGYFDARFVPATALGGEETYPAWCADKLTDIQLGKWYDNVSLYTSETSVCSLVDYPGHFALVNYLLVNYRIGTFDSLAPSNNEIQAVIWMLLFNGTPSIGGNGIDSGGYISWDQGIASIIYNSVMTNGPANPPDYMDNPNLPITIIIDTTDQVNLLEVPYWVYEELDGLGVVGDCQ